MAWCLCVFVCCHIFFQTIQGSAFSLSGDNEKQNEYPLPTRQVYTHTNPYIQTPFEANQKRNELTVLHPTNDTAHQLNNWQRITTNASQDRVATKNPKTPPFSSNFSVFHQATSVCSSTSILSSSSSTHPVSLIISLLSYLFSVWVVCKYSVCVMSDSDLSESGFRLERFFEYNRISCFILRRRCAWFWGCCVTAC